MNIARGLHRLLILSLVILCIWGFLDRVYYGSIKHENNVLFIENIFKKYPKNTPLNFDDSEVYTYDYFGSCKSGYSDKEIIHFLYEKFGSRYLPAIKNLALSAKEEEFKEELLKDSLGVLIITFVFYVIGVVLILSFKWVFKGFKKRPLSWTT